MSIAQTFRKNASAWLRTHTIYADKGLIVLNKPSGLVSQPQWRTSPDDKQLEEDQYDMKNVYGDISSCFNMSEGPFSVHRLDKSTTGCLTLALNPQTARSLSKQFQEGTVKKTYLALVRGGASTFQEQTGVIDGRLKYNDGRGKVHASGKEARTEWEVLASSKTCPLSLLKLHLITGNKHQLRLHLAAHGSPILGDTLYSSKPPSPKITGVVSIPEDRIFLHASQVSFTRHQTGTGTPYRLGLSAPVPVDFKKLCLKVGIDIDKIAPKKTLLLNDQPVEPSQLQNYAKDFYWKYSTQTGALAGAGDIEAASNGL